MDDERIDYENLTAEDKELLWYFRRLSRDDKLIVIGKAEATVELIQKIAEMLCLEVRA